jgi:hypothetical protein
MMSGVQYLCISPLGAQFTKMAANGSEKAFCVFTFHECRSVTIVQRQGCSYRAPVTYVTKTWSVVLLNKKKIHILLSQVYCA